MRLIVVARFKRYAYLKNFPKWLKLNMHFKIKGAIREIETIAAGHGIKNLNRLNKVYGKANWRKIKGICRIELNDGAVLEAEVHWYEGHGIGKKEIKIKRYL